MGLALLEQVAHEGKRELVVYSLHSSILCTCIGRPHIPGFFKKLFEYGCRFAAPEAGLEKGNNEAHGFRDRAEGQVRRSSAKERETSNIKQEEPICAATRGPKPRMLLSIEDGSAEDFFAIAQTLGEGGGPSMKKWVFLLLVRLLSVAWLG